MEKKMKEKFKELLKKDGVYFCTAFALLIVTLLITTTTYHGEDFSLQFPGATAFGSVSWIVILVLGISGIFVFRNVDRKKISLEKIYLIMIIPLGIMYMIANPLGKVPDEDFHARKAMAISKGNFFSHADENGEAVDNLNSKVAELVTRSTSSYEEAWNRLNMQETDEEVEMEYSTMALYAPICHLPQAIGMFLARIFGEGVSVQCYAARLANFAVAVFLIYNAIKLVPFKKNVVFFLAMLPITLNEIASMAADALAISMCLFYICYILYLKYDVNKNQINKKDIIILTISSIIVALCKIVYIPLVLLLLILPKEKFETSKKKNIITISIIVGAILLNLVWLIYCSRFLVTFNPGVDSKLQVKYILTHPITYILTAFRTLNTYGQMFILHLMGEGIGSFNTQASVLFVFPCIVITSMLFFVNDEKDIKIDLFSKLVCLFIFIAIVALIYTSLYVQWTEAMKPIIMGIQARYFLPILLLTAIIFNNNKIIFTEKLSYRYILLFLLFLNLNALSCIAYTYFNGWVIDYYVK